MKINNEKIGTINKIIDGQPFTLWNVYNNKSNAKQNVKVLKNAPSIYRLFRTRILPFAKIGKYIPLWALYVHKDDYLNRTFTDFDSQYRFTKY